MSNYVNDLDVILDDMGEILSLMAAQLQVPSVSDNVAALRVKISAFKYDYNGKTVSDIIYDPEFPDAVDYDKVHVIEDIS